MFRLFCPDETNSNRLGAVFEQDATFVLVEASGQRAALFHGRRSQVKTCHHQLQFWLHSNATAGHRRHTQCTRNF